MKKITEIIKAGGGCHKLAEKMGYKTHSSVLRWKKSGKIPAERVLQVEKITGIPREKLRPDLYERSDQNSEK